MADYYADLQRAEDYKQYGADLRDRRRVWENEWEEIAPMVNPRRSFFTTDYPTDDEGKPVAEDVYDSTAIDDATTMRDGMVGYNVGPRIRWAALTLTNPDLLELPFVMDWLEACEKILYLIWSNSNLYAAAAEMVMDAVSIGTATMLMEDPVSPLAVNFQCRHPKETYITEGDDGVVDFWARRVWMTGRSVLKRYSTIDGKVDESKGRFYMGDKLFDECKNNPFERSHLVWHFVHPTDELILEQPMRGYGDRQWASVEILDEGTEILREDFYYESPLMSWRWAKNSDETYGRSPAIAAKAEILALNEIARTMTEATQLFVERPMNVPEELRGKERIVPWGKNYYKRDNRMITPMSFDGSYPAGIDWLQRAEAKIHNHFHADLFKMLTMAERQMTAREINERMGEKVALLSSPLTGQNTEMLKPLVKRTFNMSRRNGWLPDPPAALIKANATIDVEFIGPLAQAQQRYHQAHNINAGLGVIQAITQGSGHMEGWDNIDVDELILHVANSEGFPQKAIRELITRDNLRKARAQQQQQQQQLAQAGQVADMMGGNLGQAPEPGSLAETMSKQMLPNAAGL